MTQVWAPELPRHANRFFQDYQSSLTAGFAREQLELVLARLTAAKTAADWQDALTLWNEIKSHLATHFTLVALQFQRHTDDAAIEAEEKRLREEIEPIVSELEAKIRERVLNSSYRRNLEEKLGSLYFTSLQLEQESFDTRNIALDTELGQVMADYTKLTGTACFEVDGQTYPISNYKKFASSPDAGLRRKAFTSYTGWYLKHRDELEKIYDRALALRQKMAQNLGYKNFVPLGYKHMQRLDYGPADVAVLREEILQVMVPLATAIRERQAKALGTKKIAYWDGDFFPYWKVGAPRIPIAEQPAAALATYQKLSPQLAGHFKKMMDAKLFDLEARNAKAPGAFCTDFSDYRVPFVFLNSVGEASDITTILHECGHSFQAWESRDIEMVELRWPTLEACEVHSMGMEFLAYPYYENFFTTEDAEVYRQKHLAESILILPYIAMVDEFQHAIYEGQAQGAEGRAACWQALGEKYAPAMSAEGAEAWQRHRWIRQGHIFSSPFYYIDYAIAQVGAWQLWMQSLQDHEATMKNYLNLCRLGGTLPLKEFFAAGKLRLPFEKGVLKNLMGQILEQVKII